MAPKKKNDILETAASLSRMLWFFFWKWKNMVEHFVSFNLLMIFVSQETDGKRRQVEALALT